MSTNFIRFTSQKCLCLGLGTFFLDFLNQQFSDHKAFKQHEGFNQHLHKCIGKHCISRDNFKQICTVLLSHNLFESRLVPEYGVK